MNFKLAPLSLLMFVFMLFAAACGQQEELPLEVQQADTTEPVAQNSIPESETKHASKMHPYGGWYCPDNLNGFPAVNAVDFEKVPVVNGRLPTKDETRNGSSLMYFDTKEIPSARPLDLQMPKLARYFSKYTNKNELVIVIQAVVAEQDTVVGFRYINGGNGSAWFNEVTFLTEDEVLAEKSAGFVETGLEIMAIPEIIFDIITNEKYAKELGETLVKGAHYKSKWHEGAKVEMLNEKEEPMHEGHVTIYWDGTYIQVDYNNDGEHYVEKFFVTTERESDRSELLIVTGPFQDELLSHQIAWEDWAMKVKELSETHDYINYRK